MLKLCGKCKEEKEIECFSKDVTRNDGHHPYCKPCRYVFRCDWRRRNEAAEIRIRKRYLENNKRKVRTATRKWLAENPDKPPIYDFRKRLGKYGLSSEDYDRMYESQGGVCAICKNPPDSEKRLCVDHDHACCSGNKRACGKCVRGLLCAQCNHMLGLAKDKIQTLNSAIEYLRPRAESGLIGR